MPRGKGVKSGYTMSEKAIQQRKINGLNNAKNRAEKRMKDAIKKTQEVQEESEDEEVMYLDDRRMEDEQEEEEDQCEEDTQMEVKKQDPLASNKGKASLDGGILKLLYDEYQSRQKKKEEKEKSKPERTKKAEERKQRIEEKTKILQALKEDYEDRVAKRQTVNRLIDQKKASLTSYCKF